MIEDGAKTGGVPRWGRVALILLAVKLVYLAGISAAVWRWPDFNAERAARIGEHWFPAGWAPGTRGEIARHFATWDAEHYLYLSAAGYRPEARSRAFYPLWPLAIRAGTAVTGLGPEVVGLALANLFSLAGWLLFHRAAARRFGERTADVALALLVAFPGALFFQFIYSESLFFLLIMILWWGLERRRYGPAGVAAFLAPLTRGVGAFAVLPLAWHAWSVASPGWLERIRARGRAAIAGRGLSGGGEASGKDAGRQRNSEAGPETADLNAAKDGCATGRVGESGLQRRARWTPWWLVGMPALGWAAYLGLMWVWTGDPWAGIAAQKYWGVHSIANLWDLPKFARGFFEVTTWHGFMGSLLDRIGFLLLLYALPALWRRGRDLLAWTLMLGVVPAMSGTFVSFLRFESCVFPVFLAWALFFTGRRRRWPLAGSLALSLLLHGILLWRFVNYRWAG